MNADRLVHLRKSRGLTQKEVADKLKISRSSYAQYELGRRRPDYETLIGIANLYDVSIDYLLGRTDNPRPPSSEQTSENKTSATSICSKDPYQQMIDDDTPADESHETVRSIDLKRLLDEIKARLNEFDEIKDRLTNLQRYLSLIASFSFEADDMSKSKFAERLRKLRLKMGISQIELAEKIGVSNFAVSRYERGATSPDPEIIIKLADFFGVTTDYLLGRTDDPTPTSENTSPSPSPPPNRTRSDAPSRPKDPYQQMIDEAIEQLEPEERRIIERIRSMPDLDLQFKDFESDPVQNLRDLVKIWREIHPEDVEDKQKIPNVTSDSPELKKKLKVDDHTIDRELILSHLDEIERRLGAIERHLALITGFGLEELLLLRRLKERPEIISLLMEQLRQGLEK